MRAGEKDGLLLNQRLTEFLFSYRSTPHSTTGISPAELFVQRRLKTKFDLLRPDRKKVVTSRQCGQKPHSRNAVLRSYPVGSDVMVRDYRLADKGPVTYEVGLGSGNIVKRHIDQLTQRLAPLPVAESVQADDVQDNFMYPDSEELTMQEVPVAPQRYPQRDRRPPDRLMH